MAREVPRAGLMFDYERTAREYLANLPLESQMEGTDQACQRLITLVAFEQIQSRRPDVQPFNELLIQYDHGRPPTRRQVVPDNMVVLHEKPIRARGSFDVPLQPAKPFFVLEYVSPSSERKDYADSYEKYEKHLKVPYYLVFYAGNEELTLFQHNGRRYVSSPPGENGRYAISELEIELALVAGWVRFWFRGERLEMPSHIRDERDEARRERDAAQAARDAAQAARDAAQAARDAAQAARDAALRERDEARRREEANTQKLDQAAAEIERLRRQLAGQGRTGN